MSQKERTKRAEVIADKQEVSKLMEDMRDSRPQNDALPERKERSK
jgi:hypothetical protein